MDIEKRIASLEREVINIRNALDSHHDLFIGLNGDRHDMTTAIGHEITGILQRLNKIEDFAQTLKRRIQMTAEKTWTVWYKIFPGMMELDDALDRAAKAQPKKRDKN